YTKQIGVGNEDKIAVKVDAKVVLQEREQFTSDLLKKSLEQQTERRSHTTWKRTSTERSSTITWEKAE
ncbi:hypothetical protein LEP1GSC137_3387, partial [Leptospira borgpetersenii str. Noumea 25]